MAWRLVLLYQLKEFGILSFTQSTWVCWLDRSLNTTNDPSTPWRKILELRPSSGQTPNFIQNVPAWRRSSSVKYPLWTKVLRLPAQQRVLPMTVLESDSRGWKKGLGWGENYLQDRYKSGTSRTHACIGSIQAIHIRVVNNEMLKLGQNCQSFIHWQTGNFSVLNF